MKVHFLCNDGHKEVWESCRSVQAGSRPVPIINLLITCYTLFSGMHWSQLKVFQEKNFQPIETIINTLGIL